jgi:Alpha mannosidase middle domain
MLFGDDFSFSDPKTEF